MSGWTVQRSAYPEEGPPVVQTNWIMWAFSVVEIEFYVLQADMHGEREHARGVAEMHRKTQAQANG